MTSTLKATAFQQFIAQSGNDYTANAQGIITSVAPTDVADLLNAGCTFLGSSMAAFQLNLLDVKLPTGLQLAVAAAAGVFGVAMTAGTSLILNGEVAQNNTKTDVGVINFRLPDSYQAGEDLTVTLNANIVIGSGTAGTKTIDLSAYEVAAGAAGADLVTTAAQNLTNSAADYAFTVTGDSLLPGDLVQLKFTVALQETVNSPINAKISSITVAQAA